MDFSKRYLKLNAAQKKAVDTIDGPVMVIAGPGTGKTELLGMRVANILSQTDTLPQSILCLTFTDSGAVAMRERLFHIIGKEAYKVAVHTFHSFGSEVINQNSEFFYQGANFSPASQLSTFKIMSGIFEELGPKNKLSKKMNDEYTYLKDSTSCISEIKKSGFYTEELIAIMDDNDLAIELTEKYITPIFNGQRPSVKMIGPLQAEIQKIRNIQSSLKTDTIVPLKNIIADTLAEATIAASEAKSTKPITAWRDKWFKKDHLDKFVSKSKERQRKLRDLMPIYDKYLNLVQESSLYDFDDMILRVTQAIDIFDELRYNLQEKYQYILVDEFQDTNLAQMRILHSLTNNPAVGDTPNIFVVGDDDQAIYNFQGADVSNILNFQQTYPKVKVIALTDNYRSGSSILDVSRQVIIQGENRLESSIESINKTLTAIGPNKEGTAKIFEAENIFDERQFIVDQVEEVINSGQQPSEIAILTRKHDEILQLLPYFSKAGVPVNYERKDDVLKNELIQLIYLIATTMVGILRGQHDAINCLMPEILAHRAWNIVPSDLWQLSLTAHKNKQGWLEAMSSNPVFQPIHEWFINGSSSLPEMPLEQMLDIIIGRNSGDETEFISPLYNHYFGDLDKDPSSYLLFLNSLRTIRSELCDYMPNSVPTLETFVEFIELNKRAGNQINLIQQSPNSDRSINLMTAHKSKGLEFDYVFIYDAVDNIWGEKARSRSRTITYPENMPFMPAGDTIDDRLRLFYVAMTRARKSLTVSYSLVDDRGRSTLPASFLANYSNADRVPAGDRAVLTAAELAWYQPIIDLEPVSMKGLLADMLDSYKLSVTHLHNFLDVTRGGPQTFLMNNLLHFPQAKTPNAAYGTAIHETLQAAHKYVTAKNDKQPIEDILKSFENNLVKQRLTKHDFSYYFEKGSDDLRNFLNANYAAFSPNQIAELDFASQQSHVGNAHLTGKLDVVEINKAEKTVSVTDYKTGAPLANWKVYDEGKKIKLHKYKQQIMFYKLLVENSRDFSNLTVQSGAMQFIEPLDEGNYSPLVTDFDPQELDRFASLINAAWTHIIELNLPNTDGYGSSYRGIVNFEQDLIDGKI